MEAETRRRLVAVGVATLLAAVTAAGPAQAASGTGSLQVTVTTATGAPTGGTVYVYRPDRGLVRSGELDAEGRVTLTVPAGSYRAEIVPATGPDEYDYARAQWWHGKTSFETADTITVTAGATVEITEQLLPTGSIEITARDSSTGASIADFCAADDRWLRNECSEGSGTVTLADLPPGTHLIWVFSEDDTYLSTSTELTVQPNATTTATVELAPAARIETTIVDAATGAPVPNACVAVSLAGSGRLPESVGYCSEDTGAVTIGYLEAGSYQLFVEPPSDSGLGAQWVGWRGGTGDPARARVVRVSSGATVQVPPIRLDPAGTISGVVTSAATGQPVRDAYVSLSAWGRSGPTFGVWTDEQGRYQLDWLGPYPWRLFFTADDHARQWSGGTADRRLAERIPVRAGQTTTYSPALQVGTVLTGQVTDASGAPLAVDISIYHAQTDDLIGDGWSPDGTYRSLVLGPTTVKILRDWYDESNGESRSDWYDGAQSFEEATPVPIAASGEQTLDMVIDTD